MTEVLWTLHLGESISVDLTAWIIIGFVGQVCFLCGFWSNGSYQRSGVKAPSPWPSGISVLVEA